METLFERLLNYYNLTEEEFNEMSKSVSYLDFDEGHKFDRMDEVVNFVKSFVNANKKVIVYGDYDADGIMATSIIIKMFKYVDFIADYYIPSRYLDGYGINIDKAKEIVNKGYDLVITVDNGISAFEPIKYLKDNGVSVVVFDHHEMQEKLPECDYYLHPLLSNFGDTPASGAFVSFMFSKAFLNRYDKYLATLASISLITDMMPLKEYNRNLLRVVIENYKDGEFLPIDLLKDDEVFSDTTIGMKIGPKINSIGRLKEDNSVNDLVDYFTSENKQTILNYISWINDTNEERKNVSKSYISGDVNEDENLSSYVLKVDAKEGIIGLIANSLVTKYKKPSIIFAKSCDDGVLKGSCRVPEGYNIVQIFDSLKDLLVTFGGHAHAGGCSIKEDDFDLFKEKFNEYIASHPAEIVDKKAINLYINELTYDNYELIKKFGPFGEGMRAPIFMLPRIKTGALMYSRSLEHIMTQVGTNSKLTGFNFPKQDVSKYQYIDLYGTMRINEFRGFKNLEFLINEIKESK